MFLIPITTKADRTAQTTDGIVTVTWLWVSTPGVGVGGFWTIVAVE